MYSWEAKDNYYYTIQHQTHFSSYFKSTVKKKEEYDYVIYGLNWRLWLVLNNPWRTNFQWKVLHLWLRSANPCSIIIAVIHNKMMRLIRVTHDIKTVYTHHNKLHRYNNNNINQPGALQLPIIHITISCYIQRIFDYI